MNIDKTKLPNGIWYEDEDGNYIPHDGVTVDAPPNAHTAHVCFPLEITERIYLIEDVYGHRGYKGEPMVSFNTHIGGGSVPTILGMVNSGDYTLAEALALYSSCCERCANVLAYKYTNGEDGYKEYSDEWHRCNTSCRYCEAERSE